MLFPTKLSGMLAFIIFPNDGRGVMLWVLICAKLCNMLADVVANVCLLLVELNIVLILWTTIVVTDVMSLGAKMLCGTY